MGNSSLLWFTKINIFSRFSFVLLLFCGMFNRLYLCIQTGKIMLILNFAVAGHIFCFFLGGGLTPLAIPLAMLFSGKWIRLTRYYTPNQN